MGIHSRTHRCHEEGSLCFDISRYSSGLDKSSPAGCHSPFKDIDSKVGWTVTSLEVENSILSSALRSIPPALSAILLVICVIAKMG